MNMKPITLVIPLIAAAGMLTGCATMHDAMHVNDLANSTLAISNAELACYNHKGWSFTRQSQCANHVDATMEAVGPVQKVAQARAIDKEHCYSQYRSDANMAALRGCRMQANASHSMPSMPDVSYYPIIYPSDVSVSTYATPIGADTFVVTPYGTSVYHAYIQH